MPDLKPKAMTVEEAMALLKKAVNIVHEESQDYESYRDFDPGYHAALATLTALVEENERLRNRRICYPIPTDRFEVGPDGIERHIYDQGETTASALLAENASLKAEVVEWKDNYADAQGDAACYKAQADSFATLASEHKARAEKAEAENAALKEQLDAARPLLHAITHKYLIDEVDGGEDWKERVIRKALAYRASREEK